MQPPEGSSLTESARGRSRERTLEPLPPLVSAALEPVTASLEARLARIADRSSGSRRYTVLGELAAGGMGRILRAWDEALQREVAMKIVARVPASGASEEELADHERRLSRFIEEARITGQLDHPGIVPVYEIGVDEPDLVFFTMPLVRGESLKRVFERVHRGEPGWTQHRALALMRQVCLTVAFAHSKGVVHRDLKPENIMIGPFGEAYVMDWGLALLLGRTAREGIVGTPAYMSPEQASARADGVGPRSDVYSLGAILYELFARRMPHELSLETRAPGEGSLETVLALPPRSLHALGSPVPRELAAVCEKAMATAPEQRYQSALELAEDLEAWLEGRVVRACPSGPWERFRKWRLRNRALSLALDSLAALSLTSVLAFVLQERSWFREVDAKHRQALLSGYSANLSAADLGLRAHETGEAERRLAACPAELRGWEWRHLALRADPSERVLRGHEQEVRAVAVHPDGTRVATGSDDGTVRIWDAVTGEIRSTLAGHGGVVTAVAFTPDGLRLVSASRDDRVRVWRASTARLERALESRGADVLALAISSDGTRLASGDTDGVVTQSSIESGETLAVLEPDLQSGVAALDADPCSERLAIAYQSGVVRLWDPASSPPLSRDLGGKLRSLDFSPDGQRIAVACGERALVLDAATLSIELELAGHASALNAVVFDPAGTSLASCGYDNVLRVWPVGRPGAMPAATPPREFDGHDADVNAAVFFPDGRRLLSGAEDDTARIWDLERTAVVVLERHRGWVNALAFSPDGSRLLSGSHDRTLRLWDARTGAELATHEVGGIVDCVAWSARDELVFGQGDPAPRAAAASALELERALEGGSGFPKALACDRAGERVFCRDASGGWSIRSLETGEVLASGATGDDSSWSLAVHPDGLAFATGTREGLIQLWDARTGALRALWGDGQAGITALAFAPDGETLAAGRLNRSIALFSTGTGALVRVLDGHENLVSCLAFSLDGTRLVSGAYDHTLRVWSPASGETLLVLHGHREPVTALAFDPAGETLASASKDGTLRLWRTAAALER